MTLPRHIGSTVPFRLGVVGSGFGVYRVYRALRVYTAYRAYRALTGFMGFVGFTGLIGLRCLIGAYSGVYGHV